jgi:hypothetical protein
MTYEEELEKQIEAMREELEQLHAYEDVVEGILSLVEKKINSAMENKLKCPGRDDQNQIKGRLESLTEVAESIAIILKKHDIV